MSDGRPSGLAKAAFTYRTSPRDGPDPVTEADAIVALVQRSVLLRRRMLRLTIVASICAGIAGAGFHGAFTLLNFARVGGLRFAVCAVLTFAASYWVGRVVARLIEARWMRELTRRHQLDEDALAEAMAILP